MTTANATEKRNVSISTRILRNPLKLDFFLIKYFLYIVDVLICNCIYMECSWFVIVFILNVVDVLICNCIYIEYSW